MARAANQPFTNELRIFSTLVGVRNEKDGSGTSMASYRKVPLPPHDVWRPRQPAHLPLIEIQFGQRWHVIGGSQMQSARWRFVGRIADHGSPTLPSSGADSFCNSGDATVFTLTIAQHPPPKREPKLKATPAAPQKRFGGNRGSDRRSGGNCGSPSPIGRLRHL